MPFETENVHLIPLWAYSQKVAVKKILVLLTIHKGFDHQQQSVDFWDIYLCNICIWTSALFEAIFSFHRFSSVTTYLIMNWAAILLFSLKVTCFQEIAIHICYCATGKCMCYNSKYLVSDTSVVITFYCENILNLFGEHCSGQLKSASWGWVSFLKR